MDDEAKNIQQSQRGDRAQLLLNDPLLKEAFEAIKSEVFDAWKKATKPEDRDRLWQAINIAEKVEARLMSHVMNGRVAKTILEDLASKRKRAA